MMQPLHTAAWYLYLTPWQRELVVTSERLLDMVVTQTPSDDSLVIPDYSYLVFPLAKAYEGFLKKYLLDLGLITPELYNSRRFRIGRALNPDVHNGQKDEFWVYDDVSRLCGPVIARQLWQAWLEGRNQVFHYFPDHKGKLSLAQAQDRMMTVSRAMDAALQCPYFLAKQTALRVSPAVSSNF